MKRLIVTLAMLITVIALNAQNAARIAENLKNDIRIFATAEVVQSSDDLFIANLVSDCTESEGVEVITNQVLSYNDIVVLEPWAENYDCGVRSLTTTLLGETDDNVYAIGIALVENDGLWMTLLVARADKNEFEEQTK